MTAAKGIIGWDSTRAEWLEARREGVSATDVAAILGHHKWKGPWSVWADKFALVPDDATPTSPAAQLGTDLEPWLLRQASGLIGQGVASPDYRLYRHPDGPWMASPDGVAADGSSLVECKTGGLISGYRSPDWSADYIPYHYELQCRWQMMVLDAPRVHVVALIAGMGVTHHVIERNAELEAATLDAVSAWWDKHVILGEEPTPEAKDSPVLAEVYPSPRGGASKELGDDALKAAADFARHADEERAAKAAKEQASSVLKAALGDAQHGTYDGREIASWSVRRGSVDYKAALEGSGAEIDVTVFRRPDTRTLNVKGF